jgi:hypothetical protein
MYHVQNKCQFINCSYQGNEHGVKFTRIPPKPTLRNNPRNIQRLRYQVKLQFRNECLKSMGLKNTVDRKDIRICNKHATNTIYKNVVWIDNKGKRKKHQLP